MAYLQLSPDELLTTTRSVRKRLDFTRPVELETVYECLEIASQAPSGSNIQAWHFILLTEPDKKAAIADLYRRSFALYAQQKQEALEKNRQNIPEDELLKLQRMSESSQYLADHMHEAPILLISCIKGRTDNAPVIEQAASFGSILPATWSFMLAARARGLGTCWTTLHLRYEREAADVLGIPFDEIMQTSLTPVAYTIGTDFKPGTRRSLDNAIHINKW